MIEVTLELPKEEKVALMHLLKGYINKGYFNNVEATKSLNIAEFKKIRNRIFL